MIKSAIQKFHLQIKIRISQVTFGYASLIISLHRPFTNFHKQGQTIIVITHEIEVANQAERIISIKDGKIFEDQKVLK